MSVLTVNAGNSVTLDAPVHSIQVDAGTATFTSPALSAPEVIEEGGTFSAGDTASVVVHATSAIRINVTYSDEVAFPEAPAAEAAPEPTPEPETAATEAGTVEDGAGI